MNKFLLYALVLCLSGRSAMINSQCTKLPNSYPSTIEKLIFFKHGQFKAFYGGPVDRAHGGVKWIMPIVFEDDKCKTRAVYEVAFINCDLSDAVNAQVLYLETLDINIKLKNELTPDYAIFSALLDGTGKDDKYVVIRFADTANVFYPDIYIYCHYGGKKQTDKYDIVNFLHGQFHTQNNCTDIYLNDQAESIKSETENKIIYEPFKVQINFGTYTSNFIVTKHIQKNDLWKIYYIICKSDSQLNYNENILIRLDSGCVSGQIYNDESCDCIDQLHDALKQLAVNENDNGIIVHIPAHDGRGFGTAPKAETEIYKRGGKGRIHTTEAIDTVAAAQLLYGNEYDLRTFDGAAEILRSMNITKVTLLTDNVEKVTTLQKHGIEVARQKTDTNKTSCMNHIKAKQESPLYFPV